MAKHRIPRKLKKEMKKRYRLVTGYTGKTTMTGIDSNRCWILPGNESKFHDFAKYE